MTFVPQTLGQAVAVAGLMPARYMSDRWVNGWWSERHSGVQEATVAYHDADGTVLRTHDIGWPVEPTTLASNYTGWILRRMRDHGARYVTVTPLRWYARECGTIPPVLLIGRRPVSVGPDGEPLGDWDGDSRWQLAWEDSHPPR